MGARQSKRIQEAHIRTTGVRGVEDDVVIAEEVTEQPQMRSENPWQTLMSAENNTRFEASTQTDPVEECGYDMKAHSRPRKMFGVVAVVENRGESEEAPRVEEDYSSHGWLSCVKSIWICWVKCFTCKWLERL